MVKGEFIKIAVLTQFILTATQKKNDIRKSNILTLVALNPTFSFLYRCKTHDFGFIKHIAKTKRPFYIL